MTDDGSYDLERDLRPLEDYAIVSLIGCAIICLAPVLLSCLVWAMVAWL